MTRTHHKSHPASQDHAQDVAKHGTDRYRLLFDLYPDAVVVTAGDSSILDANAAAIDFFECSRRVLNESRLTPFLANTQDWSDLLDQLEKDGRVIDTPILFVDRHEKIKHCNITIMPLTGFDGGADTYQCIIRDVTIQRQAFRSIQYQKQFADQLIDIAPEAIVILDLDDRALRVNEEFCRLFQYTPEACVGRRMEALIVPESHKAESLSLCARATKGESFEVETRRMRKDGSLVDVSMLVKPICTENDEAAIYVIYRNITERRKADEALRHAAYHDTLTGLPNRKAFYACLDDLLHHAGRRSSDRIWALMFLDLDKFKQINDSLGHDIGDLLLKAMAQRLRACIRETDHLFRLGGDEFTIILTDLEQNIDVAQVARKIITSVTRRFHLNNHEVLTSTSIGISIFPNDGWEVEKLVKNADMAMYVAKEHDGGNYRFYTEEMNQSALFRIKMEAHLKKAVESSELLLHYQPVVDASARVIGVEALLRWHHPEMGIILPADFIRISEDTGIIVSIGQWVLTTACDQLKRWHDMGFFPLFTAVNISARQFYEPGFEDLVIGTVDDYVLPKTALNLEVTESSVMQNPEVCIAKMENLRARGITFSIDDFGTGYSSLSYLKRFPIDALKIDRSFVANVLKSKGDQEIIRTIIAMARNLSIEAVAEGVETEKQKEFLVQLGCAKMQGHLFAEPLTKDQMTKLLESQKKTRPNRR